MSTTPTVETTTASSPARPPVRRQRWWLEIPLAVAFYYVYSRIRDLHGSPSLHPHAAAALHARAVAQHHGFAVLHAEQLLHLDVEHTFQHFFLHARAVIIGMDVFYGTAHFVFTCLVFLWLLLLGTPERFRRGRNVLAIGTAIGLLIFALYPTMPPRLMPPGVKTIDTNEVIGGLWSYNHGVIEHISDPYAAMPSLHIVWASWVSYAIWSTRSRASRWRHLLWLYPVAVGVTIVATGVHWVLDLFAGALLFAVSLLLARWIEGVIDARRARRTLTPPGG